ncbi:MAG TPA: hypothetical protein VFX61_16210 [Micromonosporaceae bacterium]|nr:hypothetical protein [Micromonosporaceae bacterium]
MSAQVPLPSAPPGFLPASLLADIDAWINSSPLRRLVRAFDGSPPITDTRALLSWLDAFSADHWDFRQGRERPEAREPTLDPVAARTVLEAASALGLTDSSPPPHHNYRHVIILGGLAPACLRRTAYTAHLLHTGVVKAGEVSALGSFRELTAAEHEVLAAVDAADGRFEMDALDAGIHRSFPAMARIEESGRQDGDLNRSWSVRLYRPVQGPQLRLLAAPSGDPAARRAHTADTQRFWARQVSLRPGDRVLVVTAPLYVPFQHCDAVRTLGLPYGCGVDTIGVDPAYVDGLPPQPAPAPGHYLQEIRSALRSMRALHAAVTDGEAGR